MKKKGLCLLVAIILLTISILPISSRTIDFTPTIVFDGTRATCTVRIAGDRVTDTISATMKLRQGNTVIDEWSGSASGILKLEETATVKRGKSYTLVVNATINGIAQPTVTVDKTNN